jgi:uncharacterized glyoxalase superfamily protein PhnB
VIPNRSVPSADVIPVLAYPDAVAATEWRCGAFGFRVRLRIGQHRAQLVFGEGAVIVTQAGGIEPDGAHSVHVRVEDANAHHERAAAFGAEILGLPAEYPYGERQYTAKDVGGHRWTFSESIADVDPASWGASSIDLD